MSAHKTQNITLSPFVERVVNNFEKRLLVIITKRSVVMRVVSLLIGPTHNVSFRRQVQFIGTCPDQVKYDLNPRGSLHWVRGLTLDTPPGLCTWACRLGASSFRRVRGRFYRDMCLT